MRCPSPVVVALVALEDADTALQPLACLDDSGPAQRRANRLRDAVRELLTRRGADLRYGRTLPRALRGPPPSGP